MKRAKAILMTMVVLMVLVSVAEAGISISFSSGRGRVYRTHRGPVYHGPHRRVRRHYRPSRRRHYYGGYYPRVRSTYFAHPGPGGMWMTYTGRRGYAYGGYFYYPIHSVTGTRLRYRRILLP